MPINLTAIHMLHCVLGVVRIVELDVAEPSPVLRMETVGWELDGLDFSVAGEDLDDMFLGHVAGQAADVDASWTRCRGLFASTAIGHGSGASASDSVL